MVYLVIGRRKRGKTTLAYYMARRACPSARMIFDSRRMIIATATSTRVTTRAQLSDQAVPALLESEIEEVIYSPPSGNLALPFRTFCAEIQGWIDADATRPLAVVIDELSFLDKADRDPDVFRRVLRDCEPGIVDIFITCHRPTDVPTNTRSIADYWALFQVTQEHDLDVIRERCKHEVAEKVQLLTGRSFVFYRDTRQTDPITGREEQEWELYPELPNADGKSPWYVELRAASERGVYEDRLSGLEKIDGSAEKRVDARLTFD